MAGRIGSALARVAAGLFCAMAGALVVLIAVFYDRLDFVFGEGLPTSALPSWLSMLIACAIAAALAALVGVAGGALRAWAGGRARTRGSAGDAALARPGSSRRFVPIVIGASVLVLAGQALFIAGIYGHPGWDSGIIVDRAIYFATGAEELEFYGPDGDGWVDDYYAHYPNNAFLTVIFIGIVRAALAIGAVPVYLCDLVGAASVCLGGALTALLVGRVTRSEGVAYAGLALYTVLFSFSPWVSMPYSDTYVTGFVAGVLYLCAGLFEGCRRVAGTEGPSSREPAGPASVAAGLLGDATRALPRWLAIALLAFLGYLIKPTVLIVFMAVVIAWVVYALACAMGGRRVVANLAALAVGVAVAGAVALCVVAPLSYRTLGIDADSGRSLGMSHFFMMGQSVEYTGAYFQDDVDFSTSIEDPDERRQVNMEVALERISGRSLLDNLKFYARKFLFSFGDGAFSWSADAADAFLTQIYPETTPLAHTLRSLYYRPAWQEGADQVPFRTGTQIAWFSVLVLWVAAGASGVRGRRRGRPGTEAPAGRTCAGWHGARFVTLAAMVALMGMFVYLMLFEDRGRYLYCLAPVSITCACAGLAALVGWMGRRRELRGAAVRS